MNCSFGDKCTVEGPHDMHKGKPWAYDAPVFSQDNFAYSGLVMGKQQAQDFNAMIWLKSNPGKWMVISGMRLVDAELTAARLKRHMKDRTLVSERCVIDGKRTKDIRIKLES